MDTLNDDIETNSSPTLRSTPMTSLGGARELLGEGGHAPSNRSRRLTHDCDKNRARRTRVQVPPRTRISPP